MDGKNCERVIFGKEKRKISKRVESKSQRKGFDWRNSKERYKFQ